LASYHFNEIELEHECEPKPQFSDSISSFESISTPILLPNLSHMLEPILIILIPVILELESSILQGQIPLREDECESEF